MAEKNSSRSVTMVPSQVVAISELVKVAAEAIVSRVLLRSPVGSVTVFAFAAGQELAEHTAPFDALVQVVAGRLELTIGGRPVTVAGGELVVMPAGAPHALRAAVDSTMILTMLRDRGEG